MHTLSPLLLIRNERKVQQCRTCNDSINNDIINKNKQETSKAVSGSLKDSWKRTPFPKKELQVGPTSPCFLLFVDILHCCTVNKFSLAMYSSRTLFIGLYALQRTSSARDICCWHFTIYTVPVSNCAPCLVSTRFAMSFQLDSSYPEEKHEPLVISESID